MKRFLFVLCSVLLIVSCTTSPERNQSIETEIKPNPIVIVDTYEVPLTEYKEVITDYCITSEIFDKLQRPLAHTLSSQCKPITRISWEYYMAGLNWWDIYILTGKKLGNGIYENTIETKPNCQIIELHSTRTQYDNSVLSVDMVFVSPNKSDLEKISNDFETIANQFVGKEPQIGSDGTKTWDYGMIHYSSYPLQHHENGNWVCIIGAYDSANSPY